MRVTYVIWTIVIAALLWVGWAGNFSADAKECFKRGGTQFHPIGWVCIQFTRKEIPL